MGKTPDKRNSQRCGLAAPIWLTFLGRGEWMEAQAINHCPEGMCFRLKTHLSSGSAVIIRVGGEAWTAARADTQGWLRTMTLGEIKWCLEVPESGASEFTVGVKYLPAL